MTGKGWSHFHKWATIGWASLGVGATFYLMSGATAIEIWIAFISVYANVVGHWGAYQSARAE